MKSFEDIAREIIAISGRFDHTDNKIAAAVGILRFYSGSLEWFKETAVGEYHPCMPDPASPESIAREIIDDYAEEPCGACNRAAALLSAWVELVTKSNPA